MPQRLEALTGWLNTVLDGGDLTITPASSDASFRRYFRVQNAQPGGLSFSTTKHDTLIAMDAPPELEDSRPFIAVSDLLSRAGVRVPRVLASDLEQGFLLLTDLGRQAYLDALNEQTVDALYGDALDALFTMQQMAPRDGGVLPAYDSELLMREMELFREWYLQRHLEQALSPTQQSVLDTIFQQLADQALAQPTVFVHRDYHSRNLMVGEVTGGEDGPGILDFQDAVVGPVTYDLVSLLRDCYIAWPRERVEAWALGFLHRAAETGIIAHESDATYLRWFDWMGVQRHLKAVGIFARLCLRDGKSGYLDDIPRTLGYVRDVTARYPELQPLHALLETLPVADNA
jgi:aminoglycoside/choline kinase family phosphotransferase